MSSSPPCSSQVRWSTGVGWSSVDRSSLRILWQYLDGSYVTVRFLVPFWHFSCRMGRTRPNLLTTQSWNQNTQRAVNAAVPTHAVLWLTVCMWKASRLELLIFSMPINTNHGHTQQAEAFLPYVLALRCQELQLSWWSCPHPHCSVSPASSVSYPRVLAAQAAALQSPAAPQSVWMTKTTDSLHKKLECYSGKLMLHTYQWQIFNFKRRKMIRK